MNATSTRRAAREPEWFATWFDSSHYHRLYAHRDEQEAAGFIDRLIDRLPPAPGATGGRRFMDESVCQRFGCRRRPGLAA